jgi:hypothetical protein
LLIFTASDGEQANHRLYQLIRAHIARAAPRLSVTCPQIVGPIVV